VISVPLESPSDRCNRPDCSFCSTLRNTVLILECMALMSSASQGTLGTFIRYKDGKAKTGTAVDAGNKLSRAVSPRTKCLKLCNFRIGGRRQYL